MTSPKLASIVLVVSSTLALAGTARAATVTLTGTYVGSGHGSSAGIAFPVGGPVVKVVRVVSLPEQGTAIEGYSTDAMQRIERGLFVLTSRQGLRTDTGIEILDYSVTFRHSDFNDSGVRYAYEITAE